MSLITHRYYKCNSWEEIKFLCVNSNLQLLQCTSEEISVCITKFNKITLSIIYFTQGNIKLIMNDLPENIDNLTINIQRATIITDLENLFTNLPFNLKKIKFVYKECTVREIKDMESNGKFNLLFRSKIPFNCRVELIFENGNYNVKYNDNIDEIELEIKKELINNIPLKIKYISMITFVPLKFLCKTNAGLAIPLFALFM